MVGRFLLLLLLFWVEDGDFKGLGPCSLTTKIHLKDEVLGYTSWDIKDII